MKYLLLILILLAAAACRPSVTEPPHPSITEPLPTPTSTTLPTATATSMPKPVSTPLPTISPTPDDIIDAEDFAAAVSVQIQTLDIMPPLGKNADIALFVRRGSGRREWSQKCRAIDPGALLRDLPCTCKLKSAGKSGGEPPQTAVLGIVCLFYVSILKEKT